jgi:hypothetical protein
MTTNINVLLVLFIYIMKITNNMTLLKSKKDPTT